MLDFLFEFEQKVFNNEQSKFVGSLPIRHVRLQRGWYVLSERNDN